jgi:hypothetical protein
MFPGGEARQSGETTPRSSVLAVTDGFGRWRIVLYVPAEFAPLFLENGWEPMPGEA